MAKQETRQPLVQVKNLSVYFRRSKKLFKAVDNASFDIYEGEVFGLIGESGSGKTTLGRSIIGLWDHANGSVIIDDKVVNPIHNKIKYKERKELANKVQMIFQNPKSSLNPIKNVEQIISEGLMNFNFVEEKYKKKIKELKLEIKSQEVKLKELQDLPKIKKQELKNIHTVKRCELNQKINELKLENSDKYKIKASIKKVKKQILVLRKNIENEKNYTKKTINYGNEVYSTKRLIIEEDFDNNSKMISTYKKQEINEINLLKKKINKKKYEHDLKVYESKIKKQVSEFTKLVLEETSLIDGNEEEYKKYCNLREAISKEISTVPDRLYDLDKFISIALNRKIIDKKTTKAWSKKIYEFSMKSNIDSLASNKGFTQFSEYIENYINQNTYKTNKRIENIKKFLDTFEEINNKQESDKKIKFSTRRNIYLFELEVNKEIINILKHFASKFEYYKKLHNTSNLLNIYDFTMKYNKYLKEIYLSFNEEKKQFHKDLLISMLTKKKEDNLKQQLEQREKIYSYKTQLSSIIKEASILLKENYIKLRTKLINEYDEMVVNDQQKISKELEGFTPDQELINKQKELIFKLKRNLKNIKVKFSYRAWILDKKSTKLEKKISLSKDKLFKSKYGIKIDDENNSSYINQLKNEIKDLKLKDKEINQKLKKISEVHPLIQKHEELKEEVLKMMDIVGLNESQLYRYPEQFSGGQQQRIGIARALITKPKLIIADEPISALDISIQAQVINLLNDLKKKLGLTILFIAHDLRMVQYISDRIAVIVHGQIVEVGNAKEIIDNPIHPYTKSLVASIPTINSSNKVFKIIKYDFDNHFYDEYNKPKWNEVNSGHKVLGSEEEIKEWTK